MIALNHQTKVNVYALNKQLMHVRDGRKARMVLVFHF